MMSRQDNSQTHPNFHAPIEVGADPSLSKQEKAEALEDLEQDARQLAIASGEGMSGGEPTALAEVLHAKEALEAPSTDFAYEFGPEGPGSATAHRRRRYRANRASGRGARDVAKAGGLGR
jgi:hypothetical protein